MQQLRLVRGSRFSSASVWRAPLPEVLARHAEKAALRRHGKLADRHGELQQLALQLERELRQAAAQDQANAAAALAADAPIGERSEPAVRDELAAARREFAASTDALPLSAQVLAESAAGHLEQALDDAGHEAGQALVALLDVLETVRGELDTAAELLAQQEWLRAAIRRGSADPYRAGRGQHAKTAVRTVDELVAQIEAMLERRSERDERFVGDTSAFELRTQPQLTGGATIRVTAPG